MKNTYLTDIIGKLDDIKNGALKTFGALSGRQINWKPAQDKWSIGQCFDHLTVSNDQYFHEIESIAEGHESKNIWKHVPVLPKFFGSLLIRSLDPKSEKKFKAPAVFAPSSSGVSSHIIEYFAEHQNQLIELIRKTDSSDHNKAMVTSPVAYFITYTLKDTCNIIVIHEQRHFLQAETVMKLENFPK